MIKDLSQATDEINSRFNDEWTSNGEIALIVGYTPVVRWHGVEEDKPDGSKFWLRHSTQNVFERQTTLSRSEFAPGQKRYTCYGLVFVQIFCPKLEFNAKDKGQKLAQFAKNAYRGKTTANKIVFKNVRIASVPDELDYYRFNVISEYEYDELF